MAKCAKCGKKLGILSKKYYIYPGKEKGSLEITDEKIVCERCMLPRAEFYDKKANVGTLIIENMMEKKYNGALEVLESVFDKENSADWYSKGSILTNLGKPKEALKCFDEALFLDTHYVKAWYKKGRLLLISGKYQDAEQCFANVVKLEAKIKVKKEDLVVKKGFEVTYDSQKWMFAAMLNWAIALMKQKKFKEADAFFAWVATLVRNLPPFKNSLDTIMPPNAIDIEAFARFCLENYVKILDLLEPKVIAEISVFGRKH